MVAVHRSGDGLDCDGASWPTLVVARDDQRRAGVDLDAVDGEDAAAAPEDAACELAVFFCDPEPAGSAAGDGQSPVADKRIGFVGRTGWGEKQDAQEKSAEEDRETYGKRTSIRTIGIHLHFFLQGGLMVRAPRSPRTVAR